MSFILNLGDLGTFFSDELSALENFTNFLSSDFVNFFNTVVKDIENTFSFIGQAISDIPTFMQNIANNFLTILQNFVQTAIPVVSGFLSWLEEQVVNVFQSLSTVASDFINDAYNFFINIANSFANIASSIITDFLTNFGQNMKHISSAISQIVQFLTPFFAPITIGKFLPTITDKLAEILPEVEIDLAPVGLGGKIPIKFGEIVKALAETAVDFFDEVREEAQQTLKEFIKEPFISDFKISIREIFNEVGLGDLPFADPSFKLIANWVSVRSFDEVKDHLKETILLTGYPAWFTDAYLQSPIDDFVPKNPLFKPVSIRDVILASQYGILDFSAVSQYAYNNLITPTTAKLMYKNQTARLLQRAVEEGIRQFIITPDKAYQEIINNVNLSGKDLFEKVFTLEYEYAVQRIVRQFLRSLLSRALSNFGRPYLDLKTLESTVQELFKELGYPKKVQDVFNVMIEESQLVYSNQLLLTQLEQITRLGVFDEQKVKTILQANKFNEQIALQILNYELQYVQLQYMLRLYEQKLKAFIISSADAEKELKALGFNSEIVSEIVEEYQHIPLVEYQISQIESLAKKGYINSDELKKQLHPLQITKEFEDIFINYTNQEIQISTTLSIIEEQLKNFLIDEKSAENELKKLKINEYLIDEIKKKDFEINLNKLQLSYAEDLAKKGYLSIDELKKQLQQLKIAKEFENEFVKYINQETQISSTLNIVKEQLKNFLIDSKTAEEELKKLNINEYLINEIIKEEYETNFAKLKLSYIENLAKKGYLSQDEISKELHSLKIIKEVEDAFIQYINQEIQISTTLSIIKEQLKNFLIDSKTVDAELKKLKINEYLVNQIMKEDYEISLTKLQLSYFESLAKNLYIDEKQLEQELGKILKDKTAVDVYAQKIYYDYIYPKIVNYHVSLARHGIISDLKGLSKDIVEYEIKPAFLEYQISLELEYVKSQLKNLQITTDQAIAELTKLGIDKTIAEIIAQTYYLENAFPRIINYYTTLARNGIVVDISKLPKEIVEYEIRPVLTEKQVQLEIEYLKTLLKDFQITSDKAIQELEKLGVEKNLANLIVQTYTPIIYNLHTIIANIIEGQLYKVGKIPVNLGNAETELKKLGIPDNQIKVLLDQYASSFGLEIWRKYLPSLSHIETAIKYNYPDKQLVEYSFIPSEFLNLYTNLYQHELVGQYVQSLKSDYTELLVYGIQNSQLENLLRQYGINETLLGVLKLSAQIKKLILGFEEVYLTPSKALSISEYISNPTQLLQKVFSEFSIPSDLQNTYLEYARNRRVRTYVNDIISTINLLFEKGKIDLGTAQSYLQQLKKYGLTDEEIQLILLNWQLRSNLSSS